VKVRELLSDESKWTKGAYARDADGNDLYLSGVDSPNASCWCLDGALHRCYKGDAYFLSLWAIKSVLIGLCPNAPTPTSFNDRRTTDFATLREVLERADV
jgi:hypothetical protein